MGIIRRPAAVVAAQRQLYLLAGRKRINTRAEPLPGLDALDTYLIATHRDLTSTEQAEALETSRSAVTLWRKGLYARGLIDRNSRASHAPITVAEGEAVARLWHDGWSRAAIAQARDICESRVSRAMARVGVTPATPRRPSLLAVDVERIFSLNHENVRLWIRAGWLVDNRPITRAGSRHSWDYDDLVALVRNRDSWIGWSPVQIADPTLRRLAEQAQRDAGGAWHQLSEIARVLDISMPNLSLWRTQYRLWPNARAWAGARYVWLTTVELAELEAQGAGVRQHRPGTDKHRWAANAVRHWLAARHGQPEAYQAAAD